jgi:hypothetical protein
MNGLRTTALIQKRLRRAEDALLGLPNVVGVGLGWKETRGRITDRPAWRVYVRRKLPSHSLRCAGLVPARVEGLATDVLPAPVSIPAASLNTVSAPLAPGSVISNLRGLLHDLSADRQTSGLGTLGFLALVNGTRQPEVVLVSNRHVLLAHGAGVGQPIYRPILSLREGKFAVRADSLDPVAEILDEGAEANYSFQYAGEEPSDYFVDCASARVLAEPGAQVYSGLPAHNGNREARIKGIARVHPLDVVGGRTVRVRKIGGVTGVTAGYIVDVAAPIENGGQPRRLNNIVIRGTHGPIVEPGDSGALIVNDRNEAIGLLWGRNEHDPRAAYACHIHPVLERLNITMMAGGLS